MFTLRHLLLLTALAAPLLANRDRSPDMVVIPAGSYAPVIRGKEDPDSTAVAPFQLDARPVTNGQFLEFVRTNPRWQRSQVTPLFAEAGYLLHWRGDLELGPDAPVDAPVVRVSWFAARAYAAWQGKRLPTTAEWERAAAAGFKLADGKQDPQLGQAALAWVTQAASGSLPNVGRTAPNFFGAHDLLTLVWEWVDDFNTAMVTGDSRADASLDGSLFCGAGAVTGRDLENYPAYLRSGMRSSLRANYVVPNLGFRCARNL